MAIDRSLPAWDRPVLSSVAAIVDGTAHVRTSVDAVERVADWMAHEAFAPPAGGPAGPFDWGDDPDRLIDATMLKASLDFAFTDFETGVKFEVDYLSRRWSDSEAMFACLHRALADGVPLLDGAYLAAVTRSDLARIFEGNIEMPMLDERVVILHEVGERLVSHHDGRFHNFIRSCPTRMYAGGEGVLERLVVEFPRFDDVSDYQGRQVVVYKLAQLALWSLHLAVGDRGGFALRDLDHMTAFADYIVPVGLRLMGVLEYSRELEERINGGDHIPRDSDEEIEIRAHTVYATALLTEAVNARRGEGRGLVIPQIDFRLWSAYHTTTWPHHLTRTVMY
ncbi:MAG TPA: queuosine salvage family protein [Acidimicrobiia bacterium]|nr:queuosine salvage family protein [Acidimicrobiia bacterium]